MSEPHDPLCMNTTEGLHRFLHTSCDCEQIRAARLEGAYAERDRLAHLPVGQMHVELILHLADQPQETP